MAAFQSLYPVHDVFAGRSRHPSRFCLPSGGSGGQVRQSEENRRFWWGHKNYWRCQMAMWFGCIGLGWWGSFLDPSPHVEGGLHPLWGTVFFSTAAVLLTHAYRWVILAGKWKEKKLGALWPRVVAASLVCAGIVTGLSWTMDRPTWEAEGFGAGLAALLVVWISLQLMAWSGAYFSLHYYVQLQEAKVQKLRVDMSVKEAALASLRSQINPHFLFNGLNTLRSLIDSDPERARLMVTQLAKIFRASLAGGNVQLVPLAQEIETVDAYLQIEKMRFEDKLDVCSAVDVDPGDALLPPFLLQTLVENAVKYGSADGEGVRRVAYRVSALPGWIRIEVENLGRLGRTSGSTGMGLKMASERLSLLYDGRATFQISDEAGGKVVARAVIPQAQNVASVIPR
ncbi:sensor histidine kinase [Verrucomicrobium spinosum]|uniref:sensor histidine kinase n=1 Tax=Verrucomicrobium spinosum TaxID=2736 RepID=UPI0009ECAD08|nr:histidine kinase [Verrucomicrobium spinosum]